MSTMVCRITILILALAAVPGWAAEKQDEKPTEILDTSFYGLQDDNVIEVVVSTDGNSELPAGNDAELRPLDVPPPPGRGRPWHHGHDGGPGRHHGGPGGRGGFHHGRLGRHHIGGGPRGGMLHGVGFIRPHLDGHGVHQRGAGGPWWMRDNATTESRLTFMCERLGSWPGHHGHVMDRLVHAHRVNNDTRDVMLALWNRRRNDLLRCCQQESSESKLTCVDELHAARFDRVCSGEEPICPWALLGRRRGQTSSSSSSSSSSGSSGNGMSTLTTRCCDLRGSERTQCFTEGMESYRQNHYRGWSHGRRGHGRVEE